MPQKFTNRAVSTLQAGINNVVTSLAVAGPDADLYAVADTGTSPVNTGALTWFKAMIIDTSGNYEIVHVRTRTGGSATFSNVIRGQDGTTAQSFSSGASVISYITAADAETMLAHPGVGTGAHAATAISNTPAGNIAATTVQAAINELDTDKLAASAVSGFGATLIDDADAAAARATMVVPSRTGGDASGNWPINVTGSAATATTATNLAGGDAGQIPYQAGSGDTDMLAAGTAGQMFQSNGAAPPTWVDRPVQIGTATVVSGSPTVIDWSPPSWAKRIEISVVGLSTSGSSPLTMRIGSSGTPKTTDYLGSYLLVTSGSTPSGGLLSSGFRTSVIDGATDVYHGRWSFALVSAATNTWECVASLGMSNTGRTQQIVGSVSLSGTLNIVRLTTENGTDTIDNGSVLNITYWG